MELSELTARAMELRERFAERQRRTGGPEWTRVDVMQGFVGDVGDLMKLVMAKEGSRVIADVDRRLGHELADCLWSVLVLAQLYGVDLEQEMARMIVEVTQKLEKNPERVDVISAVQPAAEGTRTSTSAD